MSVLASTDIAAATSQGDRRGKPLSAQKLGLLMLLPYIILFAAFVLYPVGYGLWLARHPASYVRLAADPIFVRTLINTLIFLGGGITLKMVIALLLSDFFVQDRWWIRLLALVFILPWAVPSITTILSIRFMLNPEWGIINHMIFALMGDDGPNWLNNPTLALGLAMVVHIWKSLPFWTLILVAARLAIPKDLYEAADVDGATTLQKFRFVTWPSLRTLWLTCLILSTLWSLGDFNSVYLLTGGGPADLTQVLATLGLRYLRLDQVDMSVAAVVCAMPLVMPLIYFMMKRLAK